MPNALDLTKVRRVLCHFKSGEFKNYVKPCLPNGTWDVVMRTIISENITFTKAVAVNRIMKVLEREHLDSLSTIYLQLCTIDVCLHNKRREWQAYEMEERGSRTIHLEGLHGRVKQGCRINEMECDVHFLNFDEITWFTLIQKSVRKNRGMHYGAPIFCGYILDSPFLFFNGVVKHVVVKVFLHALSYKSFNRLSLSGHDVKSLHKILLSRGVRFSAPTYEFQKPRVHSDGIDYTQCENRNEFADQCFPSDADTEKITLRGPECTWQGATFRGNKNLPTPYAMRLCSRGAFSTLKEMCKRNAILPRFLTVLSSQLQQEGTNSIDVSTLQAMINNDIEIDQITN